MLTAVNSSTAKMKRKKWSELEELTLLDKYSDLSSSGTLHKLKTREKKFKPIADHVNFVHHLQDPATFPFSWSWRDVSIKVQNMRHQYMGVKQKIRVSQDEFNWDDAENHWKNFLRYKEVFGDVELESKGRNMVDAGSGSDLFRSCLGFDSSDSESCFEGEDEEDEEEVVEGDSAGEFGGDKVKRKVGLRRRLGLLGAQVMDLRNVMVRRERKRREREFDRENCELECEGKRRELEFEREIRFNERVERVEDWEINLEQREMLWAKRESERRMRLEHELDAERAKRRMVEEKREEEEMEWRERMVGMQIEHEKAMMQLQAEACENQMQILSLMARLICQFFGSANDGLGGGLGGLPPQDLPHPGGLDDSGKPDTNSPSELGGGLGGLPPQDLPHPGGLDDSGKPDTNSPSEFLSRE